jgi:hypothetical protein
MSTPPPLIWYQLVNSANGKPYNETSVSSVLRSSLVDPIVDQFRQAVHESKSSILTGITSSQLLVYANKAAFDATVDEGKQEPLDPSKSLGMLGSEEDMLIVVVTPSRSSTLSTSEPILTVKEPNPLRKQRWIELNKILAGNTANAEVNDRTANSDVNWNQFKSVFDPTKNIQSVDDTQLSSSRSPSAVIFTGKEPNLKRKQRWIKLNEILEGNTKMLKANDSKPYSFITWNQVRTVFEPTHYVQQRRNIDETQLSFLAQYLSIITRCFGDISTGGDAKRLYFIAPVLFCVCIHLNGEVDIVVEEHLVGNFVKAHGFFEFMLRRGKKAVCIVEAKKDDVENGLKQNLVGCEVVAEVEGLDIVHGIVTNYIQWNFLRNLNDKVEMEECSLRLTPYGPERKSLQKIAEKIYAMLAS